MDRHLEIAIISGALSVVWAYALKERIEGNFGQSDWFPITRKGSPHLFWSIAGVFAICNIGWIAIALYNLVLWL